MSTQSARDHARGLRYFLALESKLTASQKTDTRQQRPPAETRSRFSMTESAGTQIFGNLAQVFLNIIIAISYQASAFRTSDFSD